MKTISKPTKTAPAHLARPASKAAFVPHEQYTNDSIKAQRHLVYEARKRNAPTYGYAKPEGYDGAELKPYAARPGANDALRWPSRTGNRLHYLDGRITDMAGNPLKENWSKA